MPVKIAAYPATGFLGGAVMAEGSQFFSNGKLASGDHVLQSAVQGMALNSVMPLAGEGFKRVSTKWSGSSAEPVNGEVRLSSGIRGANGESVNGAGEANINGIIEPQAGGEGLAPKLSLGGKTDLLALSKSYTEWVKENKPTYPTTEEFANLTPNEIVQRGFYHPDATNLDQLQTFHDAKPRPLPDAKVVASEVAKSVE